jgi:hypothetical protein
MKEGTKLDSGKIRWDLLPWEVIKEVVEVFTRGAKKYNDNNWKDVANGKDRYFAALHRHLEAYRSGETFDAEWHTPHLAHVIFNAIALRYLERKLK